MNSTCACTFKKVLILSTEITAFVKFKILAETNQ